MRLCIPCALKSSMKDFGEDDLLEDGKTGCESPGHMEPETI